MQVLDPGHEYLLNCLDGKSPWQHCLTFVKRQGAKYPGNTSAYRGTTSQEVLRALVDRARYVNNQFPCWETWLSIRLYRFIIWLYESRAARIHKRWVPTLNMAEWGKTCNLCGHVNCGGECATNQG